MKNIKSIIATIVQCGFTNVSEINGYKSYFKEIAKCVKRDVNEICHIAIGSECSLIANTKMFKVLKKKLSKYKIVCDKNSGEFADNINNYFFIMEDNQIATLPTNWVRTTTRCQPPKLKVVVGTYGSHYFLCHRIGKQWFGHQHEKISKPIMWCDIPYNKEVDKLMKGTLNWLK